jgi:hypothetical protein
LNHGGLAKRNASGPAPVRRLQAGADIDLPTIPDETVENDPKRHPDPKHTGGELRTVMLWAVGTEEDIAKVGRAADGSSAIFV